MVLLADVARINDTSLLKDYFSFSMNAFIALWSQVGYLLSSSEVDLIQNPTTKDHMRLLPYDDALEFITQHLIRPGRLVLNVFDPKIQGSAKPTTETLNVEPLMDDDAAKVEPSDDSSDCSERSPGEVCMSAKRRLRAGSKRGEALQNDPPDENQKKRKTGNSGEKNISL